MSTTFFRNLSNTQSAKHFSLKPTKNNTIKKPRQAHPTTSYNSKEQNFLLNIRTTYIQEPNYTTSIFSGQASFFQRSQTTQNACFFFKAPHSSNGSLICQTSLFNLQGINAYIVREDNLPCNIRSVNKLFFCFIYISLLANYQNVNVPIHRSQRYQKPLIRGFPYKKDMVHLRKHITTRMPLKTV